MHLDFLSSPTPTTSTKVVTSTPKVPVPEIQQVKAPEEDILQGTKMEEIKVNMIIQYLYRLLSSMSYFLQLQILVEWYMSMAGCFNFTCGC